MRISDNLSSSIPSQIDSLQNTNPLKSGLSEVPSSLNMRQNVNEGGLFDCLQQFFERIFDFLGRIFFGASEASSTVRDPIKEKVVWGKRVLDDQWDNLIANANGPHTGIVVVFKCDNYNQTFSTSFRRAPVNLDYRNGLQRELETRIRDWAQRPNNDGNLSVTTMVFTKNSDNTYRQEWTSDMDHAGSIGASAGSVDYATVINLVNNHIPASGDNNRIANALQNL